jgi:hypothetical protein
MTREARDQLGAVANLRWRLVLNSLRSVRGKLNLVSHIIGGMLVLGAALAGALAIGGASWELTSTGKPQLLAVFFWGIFLFWQVFPVMATAFTQNVDTSAFLRFPLAYRTYFLVRLVTGTLDIATTLALFWCLGLLIGISAAAPRLAVWAAIVVLAFILFNVLLARMTFAWIEHWLSRRRSREIIGLAFFVLIIGVQFIGPAIDYYTHKPPTQRLRYLARLVPVERALPPGLCAEMLTGAARGNPQQAAGAFLLLLGYAGAALGWLHVRLRQQYRGENPEGNAAAKNQGTPVPAMRRGWKLPFVPAPVSAVFEKELRYFSRSGPMLFTLIIPLVVVLLVMSGKKGLLAHQSEYFFPVGAAYSLLVLTNIVYNSFGGDGGGVQSFLMSPVSFWQIVFAKNLAHFAVLVAEVLILLLGVSLIYQPPPLVFLVFTLCWYLFAAPLNFGVGDLLSLYSPKKIDYAVFGRQRPSQITVLASLGVQILMMGTGALAMLLGYYYKNYWLGAVALAPLGILSVSGYVILLRRIDRIVMRRREVLATELCKT